MYVIASGETGPVKLGISADPETRVRKLQTGHPLKLHVYHTIAVEPDKVRRFELLLHRDVGNLRMHGEWFNLTVDDAKAHLDFTLIQYDTTTEHGYAIV